MSHRISSSKTAPIGVFDSGVGGLTVVSALMRHLPQETILYLGDTARLPYGTKSPKTVSHYTRRNVDFLVHRGVKAVVVACNTASALALNKFEADIPIWGVIEPGATAAAQTTRGRVGVLGTESTIDSDAYGQAIRRKVPRVEVFNQACPLFVPLVEEGWLDDSISRQIAERYLAPLLSSRIDTLVLGCTHYPLLKPMLQRIVGEQVNLVDSAETAARQVATDLARMQLSAVETEKKPQHHFCVTDRSERFQRIADELLRKEPQNAEPFSLEWVEV